MNSCRCRTTTILHGREGQDYAKAHLVEVKVDDLNWTVLHRCMDTGIYWKEHMKYPEAHGGGIPEYIQISEEQAKTEFGLHD